jgi:hypothetical protein
MSANLPEALFTVRLRPLADRLDANQALATATAIHETPSVLTDPRLEDALLEATYVAPSTRLLLAWPDGSLGFAYLLRSGCTVAETITTAYGAARAALEALHLQDAAPAGAITH